MVVRCAKAFTNRVKLRAGSLIDLVIYEESSKLEIWRSWHMKIARGNNYMWKSNHKPLISRFFSCKSSQIYVFLYIVDENHTASKQMYWHMSCMYICKYVYAPHAFQAHDFSYHKPRVFGKSWTQHCASSWMVCALTPSKAVFFLASSLTQRLAWHLRCCLELKFPNGIFVCTMPEAGGDFSSPLTIFWYEWGVMVSWVVENWWLLFAKAKYFYNQDGDNYSW